MTREQLCAKIEEARRAFAFEGEFLNSALFGHGHINDTFLLQYTQEDGQILRYILQRMNHEVFLKPVELIENVYGVTSFIRRKVEAVGGNPLRSSMNLVPAQGGEHYYKDSLGSYWRAYVFIEDGLNLEKVETPDDFYQSAVAFGRFQSLLADYPAETLHETIVNFHNTPDRYEKFEAAVAADVCGRAAHVADEIAFVRNRISFMHTLLDAHEAGKLPLRVTHNDTKLNNVMLDAQTRTPLCVIDLDTVMPGFSVNDFGDSIRFGATTGAEDEPDLSKVNLDLELFDCYTKGYLHGCCGALTEAELNLLPAGAKMMTLECGMRFLTDHLEGDHYFRIHREGHNLDRCRTQFKLVSDMEDHWDELQAIVAKYR